MTTANILVQNLTEAEIRKLETGLNSFFAVNIPKYKMRDILTRQDIFNEAICRMSKSKSEVETGNIKAFLKGICLNILRENMRKYSHFPTINDSASVLESIISTSQQIASEEEKELVDKIYNSLKKEELELIYCKEVLGMTWEQVVNKVGGSLNINAAKKKAQRIREKLQKQFPEGVNMY
jgi:RNA polymerase sigma factor (sigma-70 family)